MGSSYVTIDPRIGFGVSYEFKLASWGTSALNDRNSIDKTTGDLSLFLYTDEPKKLFLVILMAL